MLHMRLFRLLDNKTQQIDMLFLHQNEKLSN